MTAINAQTSPIACTRHAHGMTTRTRHDAGRLRHGTWEDTA